VVVDQLETGLVEDGGSVPLGNGETDGIGETLAQRTGGDLNTGRVMGLGVTGSDAVDLLSSVLGVLLARSCRLWCRLTRKFFRSSMVSL
jgi:hypothetical protein